MFIHMHKLVGEPNLLKELTLVEPKYVHPAIFAHTEFIQRVRELWISIT